MQKILLGVLALGFGTSGGVVVQAQTLTDWMAEQSAFSRTQLLKAMGPESSVAGRAVHAGAVIAAPSTNSPDYFYFWVRDAALVMNVVTKLYLAEKDATEKARLLEKLYDYAMFSRKIQLVPNRSGAHGIGEPKFLVTGEAFDRDWGRPQNDGPALRVSSLIRIVEALRQQRTAPVLPSGETLDVEKFARAIFDGDSPVIKTDLEYLLGTLDEHSVDLWEETRGYHFYTRLVQRRALLDGMAFARSFAEPEETLAKKCEDAEKAFSPEILRHWKPNRGPAGTVVISGLDREITQIPNIGRPGQKVSNLDSAVVLAALHADGEDGFFSPSDDRILATAVAVQDSFNTDAYTINTPTWAAKYVPQEMRPLGIAIGRYPEDLYDGGGAGSPPPGNPWVLTTAAYAELSYKTAAAWQKAGRVNIRRENIPFIRLATGQDFVAGTTVREGSAEFREIITGLHSLGDSYLRRIKFHTPTDSDHRGWLYEQMNRYSGEMTGAPNLTWSYAAVLTAFWARPR